MLETLATRLSPRILNAPTRLDPVARELDEYFAGRRREFDLPLDFSLSTGFRRIVLGYLTDIGYGQTASYAVVAAAAGSPRAFRAVGTACATNPLPVVVPCHRVIHADGSIGRVPRRAGGQADAAEPGGRMTTTTRTPATASPWRDRVEAGDWDRITGEINALGCGLTPQLLTAPECEQIAGLYDDGRAVPLDDQHGHVPVRRGRVPLLRAALPGAGRAAQAGALPAAAADRPGLVRQARPAAPWPDTLDEWLDMCHAAGQAKSTAILLRYREDDWNALHRDLYGDLVFPLQVVVNLSRPGADHTGGEFLLLEQRPRAQSRGTATLIPQGHGLVFTTRDRPVRVRARLVGRAGPARGVGDPLGPAVHPGPGASTTRREPRIRSPAPGGRSRRCGSTR